MDVAVGVIDDAVRPAEPRRNRVAVFSLALVLFAGVIVVASIVAARDQDPSTSVAELGATAVEGPVRLDGAVDAGPVWLAGAPPWGAEGQFAWQAQHGLQPVDVGNEWGMMRTEDVEPLALEDPFGTATVYRFNADGSLGEPIGVWTQAGVFDHETASAPGFDVRALIVERQGPEYAEYMEYRRDGGGTCEGAQEILGSDRVEC